MTSGAESPFDWSRSRPAHWLTTNASSDLRLGEPTGPEQAYGGELTFFKLFGGELAWSPHWSEVGDGEDPE
jgi:hypothetical protein